MRDDLDIVPGDPTLSTWDGAVLTAVASGIVSAAGMVGTGNWVKWRCLPTH